MALLPSDQRDQVKVLIAFAAIAMTVIYWMYPYSSEAQRLDADEARIAELENANARATLSAAPGAAAKLRDEAAVNRSALVFMRRLVPTVNEVPALLEEVSTAARRAGLDVGGVVPEPVISGDRFDTYRYTVTIIGGYHQVGAFLANAASLPRIVAPVDFSLVAGGTSPSVGGAPRNSDKDVLTSRIMLQTYVERTAPAASGGSTASLAAGTAPGSSAPQKGGAP